MSVTQVFSAQTEMLAAHIVTVEVDITNGTMHAFTIVGLPDKAVEEARDRVSSAIKNSGYTSPKQTQQKIVISLAPAELKKTGAIFDLACAIGYLLANEDITGDTSRTLFLGELALDGSIRKVQGVLPLIAHAKQSGFRKVFVPYANRREAIHVQGISIYGVRTLKEVIESISGKRVAPPEELLGNLFDTDDFTPEIDMRDIKGQEDSKRALSIAASGGHNIALFGPPGTGKTMLARALRGILPPLTFTESLETTSIHSIAGILSTPFIHTPPFRAPHHTSSYVSIIGGGAVPRPGEVTLAHNGVLFLDEFPEFERRVIESLREPLEEGMVRIARSKGSATFPAHFMLIAALNPCPCGNFGIQGKRCVCTPISLEKYRRKLSGPIIDRIDLWCEVSIVDYEKLSIPATSKTSKEVRQQVIEARSLQANRFKNTERVSKNSDMSSKDIENYISLSPSIRNTLNAAARTLDLSARSYHRIIKVARTIADLAQKENIENDHILEALQYRPKFKDI